MRTARQTVEGRLSSGPCAVHRVGCLDVVSGLLQPSEVRSLTALSLGGTPALGGRRGSETISRVVFLSEGFSFLVLVGHLSTGA